MKLTFRGVELELRKLPNGKYEMPNVAQFTSVAHGITWLDECRVPTGESTARPPSITEWSGDYKGGHTQNGGHAAGRFPANLLVSDDVLNDGVERKGYRNPGERKSTRETYGEYNKSWGGADYTDSGSYSRYFSLDAWAKTLPFLIVPKASKREKNEGTDASKARYMDETRHDKDAIGCNNPRNRSGQIRAGNFHPTVKPLQLMAYLITLGSRPGDVVLDCFLGSGTTAIAAKQLGRKFIGIELEKEYVAIAEARVAAILPTLL